MPPEASLRESYGRALVELGRDNPDIVALEADLCWSTMTHLFRKEFPERFFDCGIAEQNMISIAAGLAASGKIPFTNTFAVFAPGRCFDQIRVSVAQPQLNVKVVGTHGGISVGEDGISHQAIEDLALINSLPGFGVVVPADAVETTQAVRTIAATEGPFYLRLCRPKAPVVCSEDYRFTLGRAATMRPGENATIIAIGIMVALALAAADNLKQEGISCRVLNMSTLKPLDETAIIKAATETGAIVTAEDHLEHGGLGSLVSRVLTKYQLAPLECVAMKDTYAESGKGSELLERYGLTARSIEQAVRSVIKRKLK